MSVANKKYFTIMVVAAMVSVGVIYASNRLPHVKRLIG